MNDNATHKDRNRLRTPGYFIKRLRDNSFITLRVFQAYSDNDPRKWTILVDPNNTAVYITCMENKSAVGEICFELHDSGGRFTRGYTIITHSIEVVVQHLLDRGVQQTLGKEEFYKQRV